MNKEEIKKIYAEERIKFRAKHPDAKLELLFSTSIRDKFIIPFVERCLQTIEEPEEKWISVKDKLPERNVPVICARKQGSMSGYKFINPTLGVLRDNSNRFSCDMDWINTTHWMPLPNNPKE